jgi:hypothetical protein
VTLSFEQVCSKIFFKQLDLSRHSGLNNVQDVRCPRDIACVDYGQKRFDLSEVHHLGTMLKLDLIITKFYFILCYIEIYDSSIYTKSEIP